MAKATYQDKVNSGAALAKRDTQAAIAGVPSDALAFLETTNTAEVAARIAAGELEAGVQLMEIPEDTTVYGILESFGSTMLPDLNTGVLRPVRTWQLELKRKSDWKQPGTHISILGAAQLDRQLQGFLRRAKIVCDESIVEGEAGNLPVMIYRGGKTTTKKGRQLNEFFAGVEKTQLPDGHPLK